MASEDSLDELFTRSPRIRPEDLQTPKLKKRKGGKGPLGTGNKPSPFGKGAKGTNMAPSRTNRRGQR